MDETNPSPFIRNMDETNPSPFIHRLLHAESWDHARLIGGGGGEMEGVAVRAYAVEVHGALLQRYVRAWRTEPPVIWLVLLIANERRMVGLGHDPLFAEVGVLLAFRIEDVGEKTEPV